MDGQAVGRSDRRYKVLLLGWMQLAEGEQRCAVIDVSLGGIAVLAMRPPQLGEKVVVYTSTTGRLEGDVVRLFEGGFGVKLTGNSHAAELFRRFAADYATRHADAPGAEGVNMDTQPTDTH